jgi:hypothetical protein
MLTADHPHAYWTGYYTSRPALKQYIRTRAVVARTAEVLHTYAAATGVAFNQSGGAC